MDGWSDDTPSHESASHGSDTPILQGIEERVRANWPEMREKYGSLRVLGGFEEFKRLCNGKDSTEKDIIFREIATDCMKHNGDAGWNLLMLLFRPAVKAYAELKYKYFRELGDADTWTHILCGIVRGVGTAVEKGLDYTEHAQKYAPP